MTTQSTQPRRGSRGIPGNKGQFTYPDHRESSVTLSGQDGHDVPLEPAEEALSFGQVHRLLTGHYVQLRMKIDVDGALVTPGSLAFNGSTVTWETNPNPRSHRKLINFMSAAKKLGAPKDSALLVDGRPVTGVELRDGTVTVVTGPGV